MWLTINYCYSISVFLLSSKLTFIIAQWILPFGFFKGTYHLNLKKEACLLSLYPQHLSHNAWHIVYSRQRKKEMHQRCELPPGMSGQSLACLLQIMLNFLFPNYYVSTDPNQCGKSMVKPQLRRNIGMFHFEYFSRQLPN